MGSGLIVYPSLCWIGTAKNWEEVLHYFADLAMKNGFAKAGFDDALIQREKEFPTGLPMEIPIAIPHAYPEYINQPGIGIALLQPPVNFRQMGSEEEIWLPVHLVLLMLVTQDIAHSSDLSVIIRMFQDVGWYESFSKAKTPDELAKCFNDLHKSFQDNN